MDRRLQSAKIVKNGYYWAKKQKYQKLEKERPSGFSRHDSGQKKSRENINIEKEVFQKTPFWKKPIFSILSQFRGKSMKTCQLCPPISQKRDDVFQFHKKVLVPHSQEYKTCQKIFLASPRSTSIALIIWIFIDWTFWLFETDSSNLGNFSSFSGIFRYLPLEAIRGGV